jgi:hypothetical protein
MNPAEELNQLYSQWRKLTEEEGAAIGRDAWLEVSQCQAAKLRLQPRIVELSQKIAPVVLELEFRKVVDELVELEHRNAEVLRQRRQEVNVELGDCERSSRSLRQLQRLYIPQPRQNWQSYS